MTIVEIFGGVAVAVQAFPHLTVFGIKSLDIDTLGIGEITRCHLGGA